ncbi:MAG TPA: FAD:protein FMN transferase [Roseomonas sp.]|jgi:thiamine biosynthesis lipoprotein
MHRVLIPALAAPPALPRGTAVQCLEGRTMGTGWSARLVAPPGLDPAAAQVAVQRALDAVVGEMSGWEAASDLSRFNRAPAGSWHQLPDGFLAVLRAGLDLAAATDGAFDPTIGPLIDLWGFGPPAVPPGLPIAQAIAAARARVGWRGLRLEGDRALQPSGLALDLSGIAKGHGVDRAATALAGLGIASFLVEVGGELRGQGVKPDFSPWWVEIDRPPGSDAAPFRVALHGLSVATSGDYRRFFRHGAFRYAHTIDPRSGWPCGGGLASVTVLHPDCMQADALATALTVLGPEAGLAFAERHGIAALLVRRDAADALHETMSPAFAAMLDG